jgi:hypothetical protein
MKYSVHYSNKMNYGVTLAANFDTLDDARMFARMIGQQDNVVEIEIDEHVEGSFDEETGYFSGLCRGVE